MSNEQLSSREINDIFWGKKRRYMLSAATKYSSEDGFFGPEMAEEVRSIYRENQGKKDLILTGNEFIDGPPLSSGLNGMAKAIARMMLVSDSRKDMDDEESALIREIIDSFFLACSVDEEGNVYKDKEKRRESEEEFYSKREKYINLTQNTDDSEVAADEAAFASLSNRKVEKDSLDPYKDLISDTYMEQIDLGKFYVGVITSGDSEEAIYISYGFAGWIEIVWLHFFDEDISEDHRTELLRYLVFVEKERRGGNKKGIFWEIHLDEIKDIAALRRVLKESGFENRRTFNNVYDLTLGQVVEDKFLEKAAKALPCVSLKEIEWRQLDTLEYMILEDARPVPVGAYPIWDDYLKDESLVCLKGDKPVGLLLLTDQKDNIVIECAYICDKMALSVMLGKAFIMLKEKYGSDKHVIVPIVLGKTGKMVTRLAPGAKRGELIEAIQWF